MGFHSVVGSALELSESHADVEARIVVGEDLSVLVVVEQFGNDVPCNEVAGAVGSVAGHLGARLVEGTRADRVAVTLEDCVSAVVVPGGVVTRLVVVIDSRGEVGRAVAALVVAARRARGTAEDVPRRVPFHAARHVEDDHRLGGHVREKPCLRAGLVGRAVLGKEIPGPQSRLTRIMEMIVTVIFMVVYPLSRHGAHLTGPCPSPTSIVTLAL